jgi:hypothetical protein
MRSKQESKIAHKIAGGTVRTAGKIEFIRDQGPVRRDIRADDFEWSPDSLKNLAKILWAAQRSHSYAVSALRLFSKMPSSQFSPDGLMGGRGYIQSIKDLRNALANATESLSSFTDTVYDEINASHWQGSLTDDSKHLLEDTQEVKENPEEFVEDAYKDQHDSDEFESLDPSEMNPTPESMGEAVSSGGDDSADNSEEESESGHSQIASRTLKHDLRKTNPGNYDKALTMAARKPRKASSPMIDDVSALPGPRVDHIGPASGGEFGYFNGPDAAPSDDPAGMGFHSFNPIYESGYEDGITGDDNATDGMTSRFKVSVDTYSLLPGSDNNRIMPLYERGLSADEVEFMKAHSEPKIYGVRETKSKPSSAKLWGNK